MVKLIKDAFRIEGEILLQKFDKKWQEFIDLEGNAVVEDKAKLRVKGVQYVIGFEYLAILVVDL